MRKHGNEDIVMLKCTSAYPAPYSEMNLRTIPNMAETFGVIPGLSDHSNGISVPVAAVALGAKVIEKHFIMDRKEGGPDAPFSLEPHEFKELVRSVREAEQALGKVSYELSEKSKDHRFLMRSIFVVKDIKKGEVFTESNIKSIRPANGLAPNCISTILGKNAMIDINRGTPLSWSLVEIAPTKQREGKGTCE